MAGIAALLPKSISFETIAEGDLTRSDVGASIEAYLRPLEALRRITVFDLDETKCVPVMDYSRMNKSRPRASVFHMHADMIV
jgi:hypothetical protein